MEGGVGHMRGFQPKKTYTNPQKGLPSLTENYTHIIQKGSPKMNFIVRESKKLILLLKLGTRSNLTL